MKNQLQRGTAYEHTIVERLREQYLSHAPLPGARDVSKSLTIEQFYRLYRYVCAEGYGHHDVLAGSRSSASMTELASSK